VYKVVVRRLVEEEALVGVGLGRGVEEVDSVPPHVGDGLVRVEKHVDLAWDDAETRDGALGRGLEEHLHADTYPKIGPTRDDISSQGLKKPALGQAIDGGLKSADARKDERLCRAG
jgi:hypothetical protein